MRHLVDAGHRAGRGAIIAAALLGCAMAQAADDGPATAPSPGTPSTSSTSSTPGTPGTPGIVPAAVPDAMPAAIAPVVPPANATFAGPRAPQPAAVTTSAAGAAVSSAGSLTQVALVLMLVVGLIAGAAWLLRRLGMARNVAGSAIRIVSGVSLGNRERILVVEVADQWIVVGVSPGGINTLTTMARQEPAEGVGESLPPPPGKQFAFWLKQTIERRNAAARGQAAPGEVDGR